jgi:predicted transcriptional regulator
MASNFTTDQLKKMLQENQAKLDSLDSSDIVASKELKKSIDKISKLLLRTEKGILKELKESNKKNQKKKDDSVDIKRLAEENKKDLKNRFSEFYQRNQLNRKAINDSYIRKIDDINHRYKKDLRKAFSTLNENLHADILVNQKVIEKYLNRFADYMTEKITKVFNVAFSYLKNATLNAFSKIKGLVTSLGDKLGSVIKGTWEKLKGAIFHPIDSVKTIISNSLSYVWQGIKKIGSLIKDAFVFVIKKIWEGLKWVAGVIWGVIKIGFKLMWTILSGIGKFVFSMFKWISTFLLKVIWGTLVKITSFLLSAIWEGIKTVGSFLMSVMWATIKGIAKTVFQIAFTIVKTIANMVVTLITSALAPWLGLIALVGAGVYLLGYWMGWWGSKGNSETSKAGINVGGKEIKQGGIFETIGNWVKKALGIGESFAVWLCDQIVWAWDKLWVVIKKTWGITTDFGGWILDQLKIFWNWATSKEKRDDYRLFEKNIEFYEKQLENLMMLDPDKIKEYTENLKADKVSLEKLSDTMPLLSKLIIKIEDMWTKYIKPIINDVIKKIESAWEWISSLVKGKGSWSSPDENSILGSIYKSLFGTNSINWASPSYDSLLGQIYNIIFGKNTIDFKSSLGLVGFIYSTIYDINFFIIDSIEKYILPVFNSIMDFLSNIIEIISPDYAEKVSQISGSVKLNISNRVSEAKGFQLTNTKEKISELSESIKSPSNGESKEHFEKRKEETEKLIKALESKVGGREKSDNEKKRAEKSFAIALRNTTKVLSGLQVSVSSLLGSTLDENQIKALSNRPRNFWKSRGFDTDFVNTPLDAYSELRDLYLAKDKSYYGKNLKNLQADFNKNNPDWKKYIDKDLIGKLNTMRSSIDENRLQIQESLDNMYEQKASSLATGWSFGKKELNWYKKDAEKYMDENLYKIFTGDAFNSYLNPMSRFFTKIREIDPQYGLARGGIVKPQPHGVNIIAAEAGSPEVILPLNRQGLSFIDEISKRLDYTSEHKEDMVKDIVNQITKVIKDNVKADKKETYATSSKQPIFLEDNSDGSQLTKLLAMGMLNGR